MPKQGEKKVFKIQRPVLDDTDKWLFYSEGRENMSMRYPTDKERRAMKKEYKVYAQYEFVDWGWEFRKVVASKAW